MTAYKGKLDWRHRYVINNEASLAVCGGLCYITCLKRRKLLHEFTKHLTILWISLELRYVCIYLCLSVQASTSRVFGKCLFNRP